MRLLSKLGVKISRTYLTYLFVCVCNDCEVILIDTAKAAIRNLSANFGIKCLIYLAGIKVNKA